MRNFFRPFYQKGIASIVHGLSMFHLSNALVLAFFLGMAPTLASAEVGTFDVGGKVIDFGVQPMAFPIAMFSEVLKHDRILLGQMGKAGWSVREHPYFKGNDMIEDIGTDKLEALMLGDIPVINAVAHHDLLVVGLLKHTFSSVVANRFMGLVDLKGKKVGNGFGSTAHYTLLEGLSTVGLSEKDVDLVEMNVNDMPAALESGKIDAFSAWEPAPTIALAKNPAHFVAYRGISNTYLLFSGKMVERQPEVARQFLAAFARALYWMKKNPDNLRQAAQWAVQASQGFAQKRSSLTVEQAMEITKREIIDVPGAPMLPKSEAMPGGRMALQLNFLKRFGKIPETVTWAKVRGSFAPQLMEDVLRQPGKYRIHAFDYGQ